VINQWLHEARQFMVEQADIDDNMKTAITQFLTVQMQGVFNTYLDQQGFDDATYSEDEGGVRFIYLKPFTLTLDETLDDIVERFDNQVTRGQIVSVIEEMNEVTPDQNKDARGRLIGFWLDLVSVAPEFYRGEKFYVDVFSDLAGAGAIEFGTDEPAEIYQVALGQ